MPIAIPYYDPQLKTIADRYGGWLAILDPSFHISEEIYTEFEAAGYKAHQLDDLRNHARELVLFELAQQLYWSWRWLLDGTLQLPRPHESPFTGTESWQKFPSADYWYSDRIRDRMNRFSITKDDVEERIASDNQAFPLWQPPFSKRQDPQASMERTNVEAPKSDVAALGLERRYLILLILNSIPETSWNSCELLASAFLTQTEVNSIPLSNPYSFELYPFDLRSKDFLNDLFALAEDGLLTVDTSPSKCSQDWLYKISTKGLTEAAKIIDVMQVDPGASLRKIVRSTRERSYAKLCNFLYRNYPNFRGKGP